jgi:hypothetical protein
VSLSRARQKLGDYQQAEQDCQTAIQFYEKLPKSNSLSKEHLDAYFRLQQLLIVQGTTNWRSNVSQAIGWKVLIIYLYLYLYVFLFFALRSN